MPTASRMMLQLPPLSAKFWRRFDRKIYRGPEIDCAIWTAYRNSNGYGVVRLPERNELVHRVAFLRAGGVLTPEQPQVLHHCDNPTCCEASHLYAGRDRENRADMARRYRGVRSAKGLPFGVRPNKAGFEARIWSDGRQRHVGYFGTIAAAAMAAQQAKRALYGLAGDPDARP